jgi:hypothetical protein
VNFGELTRNIFIFTNLEGVTMHFNHEVQAKTEKINCSIKITDLATGIRRKAYQFLF